MCVPLEGIAQRARRSAPIVRVHLETAVGQRRSAVVVSSVQLVDTVQVERRTVETVLVQQETDVV